MSIEANVANVQARIEGAILRRGTNTPVRLLGVTKYASDQEVAELLQAGLTLFGENRVQNAVRRLQLFPQAEWHFIGGLQTNKVRSCQQISLVHSVDRPNLVAALSERAGQWGKVQDILVQVNVAGEESKGGLAPQHTTAFVKMILEKYPGLRIRGLMTMAPFIEPELVRPFFRETFRLYRDLQQQIGVEWDILSMGMTNDFEVAIEEGATLVRIGSALLAKEDEHE